MLCHAVNAKRNSKPDKQAGLCGTRLWCICPGEFGRGDIHSISISTHGEPRRNSATPGRINSRILLASFPNHPDPKTPPLVQVSMGYFVSLGVLLMEPFRAEVSILYYWQNRSDLVCALCQPHKCCFLLQDRLLPLALCGVCRRGEKVSPEGHVHE